MAVYKQTYRPYAGELTPAAWRFLILARYAIAQVFAWRLVLVFFVISFVPLLGAAAVIYLRHNLDALLAFEIGIEDIIPIDADFFSAIMGMQSTMAFILATVIGPGLVSPDLVNGALPLYLSRPLTRSGYVLGKFVVLAFLLSLITWIPGLLLFGFQAALEPGWIAANLRIAVAIVVGSWAWILTVSLLALALSAWVRWQPVAGALLFGVFFVGTGFGSAINATLATDWGALIMLPSALSAIWQWLFLGVGQFSDFPLPLWSAWLSLGAVCALSIALLARKVRAYEVVR